MNLKERYQKEIKKELAKEFNIKNPMAVPSVSKIVVNVGTGDLLKDKQVKERLVGDLAMITGQRPKVQPARVSVAGFGIREGNPIGLTVTLRGERMYAFLERLITIVLPRIRDFKGVSAGSFDKQGNWTLGIFEHTVFPEIDISKVEKVFGMEITIVTTTKDANLARALLISLGMPFRKEE